jgi:sensor histidine kinase YesM
MSHPITGNRKGIVIYSFVWLVIALLHGLMVWYFQDFRGFIVVTEALVSSILFGIMGLLAWYPTRYIPFQRHTPVYSLIAHVTAGVVVVFAWLMITFGVLSAVFRDQDSYLEFLNRSIVWRALIGGLVYLVLVLIYYLASYGEKLRERAKQEELLKNLVRDAELNVLKSQINPHFLFNSLNSISSLTLSSPDEARDMIIRLSDFLRYSLKHRENEYVPLKEEMGRMKDYLAIEKIRFGDKLHYTFELSPECEEYPVPTMIYQPLFENAIRHGVYESVEPVSIRFECNPDNEYLSTRIINNYDTEVPSKKGTGVGLENVRKRIELAYQGRGILKWNREDGKFVVMMLLPRK